MMYQKITSTEIAAQRCSAMETRDHSKNEVSPKNQRSRRNLLLTLALVAIVLPVWSDPVDENTARKVATQKLLRPSEMYDANSVTQQKAQTSLQLLYKSSSKTEHGAKQAKAGETVYFYVFGTEDNKGFVIVAGDNRVTPVLGYSETNGFPAENMPPNLQWWLGEYSKQIQYAIDNDIQPTTEISQKWAEYLDINENNKEE